VLANAAFQAAEFIGWPDARIPLAEAALYVATANKSNSTVLAIDAALKDVESARTLAVPEHLRDASYKGAKRLGHGQGYEYAHDHPAHFVAQEYLGADKRYYEPTEQGVEKKIRERVEKWREQFARLRASKVQSPNSKG
jgi:putative ATPase